MTAPRALAPRIICLLNERHSCTRRPFLFPSSCRRRFWRRGPWRSCFTARLRGERGSNLVNEIAVGLLGLVFILVVAKNRPMGVTFYGSFVDDAFTRFMGAITLVGSLVTLLLSVEFMRQERIGGFEFPGPHPHFDPRHADADCGQ